MTKEETAGCLSVLKAAYPTFYNKMNRDDGLQVLDLWETMFINDDVNVVKFAIYKLIETHADFPPTIADVKAKIKEFVAISSGEPTDEELWMMLREAVKNGIYGAESEFKKLPPVLQKYCGTPAYLRDHAESADMKIFDSVEKSHFLRQIESMRERVRYENELPSAMRETIMRLYGGIGTNDGSLTIGQFNENRNKVLNTIEQLQLESEFK